MMGGDNKGDHTTKQQQLSSSSSPINPLDQESTDHKKGQLVPPPAVVPGAAPYISSPLFVPVGGGGATSSSPFEQQFEPVNPKRQRYNTNQWKLLPSPSQKQTQMAILTTTTDQSSSPSPTTTHTQAQNTMTAAAAATAASSSDTASSPPPPHSPIPSLSGQQAEATNKPSEAQLLEQQFQHHQFRKGKYVSPVWKPSEMLWLARAWRIQYQGSSSSGSASAEGEVSPAAGAGQSTRGAKTRADKDREVAEFLQRHGVNRDAKTAGTKWDNMLGEFRKVFEWERGGESEQVGKSYFRLSPYERKLHRLPASFDEQVFEELSQFMGSRMRSPSTTSRGAPPFIATVSSDHLDHTRLTRSLPPPPPFKEDDHFSLSASAARAKQLVVTSGGGLLGFDQSSSSLLDTVVGPNKELRRIGKIRMTWEESVSLWAEEGEHHRGRIRLQPAGWSSFLNADELTFFDDAMVACNLEAFEDGSLRGFSIDRFVNGQQVKVFGRRKSSSASASNGNFFERIQFPFTEPSIRTNPSWEYQDPTDYYVGCLRVPLTTLPSLFELSWHLQEPPPEEIRFPLRRDVYRDLPQGKELFFTTSNELLDCRAFTCDILSPIVRNANPSSTPTSRDSFIGLWDDCINRVVSKFCSAEMSIVRKPSSAAAEEPPLQDQWPNVTGFVRNLCLWRGEETDQLKEGQLDPSASIVEKLLWTYIDLPYLLGYYAVGYIVTFCALSRSQDRVVRTDLYSLDLSSPVERLKALIPCYRIAGLLPLLADHCFNKQEQYCAYSDFERIDLGSSNINYGSNNTVIEMTPNTVTRFFSSKRKWAAVKEKYDFLDHRVPHAESIYQSSERDLSLVFRPRGCSKSKPTTYSQLVEALKYVTKALVALHDLCFMHRDLSWEKVMRRSDRENEWFVCGFDDAVSAPQLNPHVTAETRGKHAPEMGRGLHGVKVDVWGVGQLVRTCGLGTNNVPKMLRELQNRCLDQNPEQRPTAADCYRHLLQLQSSLSSAAAAAGSASSTAPY